MRLYTNENFPRPVAEFLRQQGHDVLTVQEAGNAGQAQTDEQVLAFAVSESRVLVTLNRRHFIALHKASMSHCGIVVCSFDPDFSRLGRRIHERLLGSASLNGRLERVNRE